MENPHHEQSHFVPYMLLTRAAKEAQTRGTEGNMFSSYPEIPQNVFNHKTQTFQVLQVLLALNWCSISRPYDSIFVSVIREDF